MKITDVVVVYPSEKELYQPYIEMKNKNVRGFLWNIWIIIQESLRLKTYAAFSEPNEYLEHSLVNNSKHQNVIFLKPFNDLAKDGFITTTQLTSESYTFMYKRVENEYTSESYINNWSTQLWLTTILTIILLSLFLYSIIYISTSHSSTNIDRNISTCFLEQISILSSQGSSLSTNISTCLRIITLTCLLFYYLLFNYYNTFLLSQLTTKKTITPFTTLAEVATKARDFVICAGDNESYTYSILQDTPSDGRLPDRWKGIVNKKICEKDALMETKVCQDKLIAVTFSNSIHPIKNVIQCNIETIKDTYLRTGISLLLSHYFDQNLKHQINLVIWKLRQSGITEYMKKKSFNIRPFKPIEVATFTEINFQHISGVLYVYIIVLMTSFLIFILEIVYYRIKLF